MIPFRGLQKTTLIDYPGKIACTLFVGGCNFRCGYCYNSDLVFKHLSMPQISDKEIFSFLESRTRYLQGVCITGGEPTLYPDLIEFCSKVKKLGYLVKLDTNGTNPELLEKLLKIVDYVAMDIKSSLDKYPDVVGVKVNIDNIKKSISLIKESGIDYEFRSTMVPDMIDKETIIKMGELLKGAKRFFIQQFKTNPKTIDKKYNSIKPLSMEKLEEFGEILKEYIDEVKIRG